MDRPLSDDLIIAGNQRVVEREYWLKQLAGAFQAGYIPYDLPLEARKTQIIACERFIFPQELAHACNRLANGSSYNLYIILSTCLSIIISKYISSTDIVLGSPVLKDDTAGDLLNTVIPLRIQLQEDMTFKELLMHVKEIHLAGVSHQNYPIEMLAAQANHDGQAGIFPFFDIVALLEDIHVKHFFSHTGPSIIVLFRHTNDVIEIEINYDCTLYEKKTIKRLFQRFSYLTSQVMEHPSNTPIMDLDMASSAEYHDLLYGANSTPATFSEQATMTQLFEEGVEQFPDRIALQFDNCQVTYAELNRRANTLARVLRTKGSQPDTIIGIYSERSLAMIVGILAVLKAGAAYLPLDPAYPSERVKYMLEDSQVQIVLTQSHLAPALPISQEKLFLDDYYLYHDVNSNLKPIHHARNLAYVIYTSGTTGKPKGVMIEHQQVTRLLRNDAFQFDFSENDTWTLFHSFCFDFSVWEMYGALFNGARLIVVPRAMTVDLSSYVAFLKEEQVTVLNQTPSIFFRIIEQESKHDRHTLVLRYVIFGGEALKPGRLKSWHQLYPSTQLINMYGITETTVHVTYKEITEEDIQSNVSNIGRPIPTTSVYILDPKLKPVASGLCGEIFVGGEGVARGYLHNPTLTQQRFIPNPFLPGDRVYRTGDMGRWRNNGEIEYIGRADQQVKIRGFRIEIGEIEAQIIQFKGITNTVVLPIEDTEDELALCAYVVIEVIEFIGASFDASAFIAELKDYLKQHLPAYMLPAFVVPMSELPVTEHGKLNTALLPNPKEVVSLSMSYRAPRNHLERQLVEIWAQVLKLPEDKIGIHDRFFDLGGNSLSVLALSNKVQETLNKQISVMSYFQYPTIVSFIAYMQNADEVQDVEPLTSPEEDEEAVGVYSMMEALTQLAEEK